MGCVLQPPGDGSLARGTDSILAVLAWFISQLPGTGPGYRGSSRPPAGRRQRNRAVIGEPGEEAQVKAQRHHPGAPRCRASGQGRVECVAGGSHVAGEGAWSGNVGLRPVPAPPVRMRIRKSLQRQ